MPNHLHLIVVQGQRPLSEFMQPLLRRIALQVQRRFATEGHVFERRFRSSPCTDADYFRNAIAYVHLNPVRAGICGTVDDYEWSSHAVYCATEAYSPNAAIESAVRLFATGDACTVSECVAHYREFIVWRCAMDAHSLQEDGTPPTREPATAGGNNHWYRHYSGAVSRLAPAPSYRLDLRDFARVLLAEEGTRVDLEEFRSGTRAKAILPIRRRFILRALDAGYRGSSIARFLNVSPATVSVTRTAAVRSFT